MTSPTTLDRFPTFAILQQIINADGFALATYASQPVNGCHTCGRDERAHRYRGAHPWADPTHHVRKLRLLARRHLTEVTARYRREYEQFVADVAEKSGVSR